jgi:nitroimidazol reductase NimA-like FMN-containing flavoprotein (pyridoxamine 5'-phosphate oxidase superfamily)
MTAHVTSHDLRVDPPPPRLDLDWAGALREIASTETYLVSTVRPNSTPHVVPVLGVWVDDRLTFNTDAKARKARNLQANPAIAVSAPGAQYDFTIEGTAHRVTDEAALHRVAAAFAAKYPWWHPHVRDGHFHADESAAPRAVIAVHARNVFGFGKASGFTATRWSLTA